MCVVSTLIKTGEVTMRLMANRRAFLKDGLFASKSIQDWEKTWDWTFVTVLKEPIVSKYTIVHAATNVTFTHR